MPACVIACGSPAKRSAIAANRGGIIDPDSFTTRATCRASQIGMMPAQTGISIPARCIRYRKLYSNPLSKNICVVRKSTPASTFRRR